MCLGKPFLLSLQTPSFLHAAVVIVPASGQQLKTIRISSFLLFHPSLEARGISQYIREEQRRTFSTMNRAFNRKKEKSWMHTPEALAKHYIAYNAKFLGNTEVEAPKGTEVVKDAVRKLKFQRHIKKSEGQKTPKVELQISIYGVKILDPKTKEVQHNCQLHRISFCADDKTDKRIFTFICKDSESNKHLCYVFDSEKCAEEITLTIGQAFDLAYKKFLESGGKDVETRKQIGSLQKRIQELETENSELKKQLQDLEQQLMIAHVPPPLYINEVNEAYMLQRPSSLFWCHDINSCLETSSVTLTPMSSPDSNLSTGLLTPPPAKSTFLPPKPSEGFSVPRPRAGSISTKPQSTDIFDMVPFSPGTVLVPTQASNGCPTTPTILSSNIGKDLFGAEPFDPFTCGSADFPPDIQSKLDEMQVSRVLSRRGSKWD
ncbi:PTB domain-containing engulfment adapter protein 1 isoform X2 [Corythoichthys intestinalis]|uniref:PTB domain-containing engulfment adapter protein 1 isoform X2 n=1 Tax=Corythoichthys intestinalis TaxID=161448 RepID=UPI0025A66B15|nr:PTB domain-containing engulfment adapter protein 1 isoform X2 [Corythoichthys intestinalis]